MEDDQSTKNSLSATRELIGAGRVDGLAIGAGQL